MQAALAVKNLPADAEYGGDARSCLENPMDGGAWQAKVHGVTKTQTQLKQRSTHTGSFGENQHSIFRVSKLNILF